ncbi:ROK family protein [Paludibaculum fermentans]|uniref:ROK family protein n=1 Tax=Paludibaculum fermentans TaxID=1473598 RepID=UPI003EB8E551
MSILAIDIGGTKFTMALFEGGRMVQRVSMATDREGGRDWMLAKIGSLGDEWRGDGGFQAIGVGFGGPVNFETQQVVLSTHVGGWQDFDLPQWLKERFGAPVWMDNDANVGALGEGVFGAGKGLRPLFYMTLSTGIGGGILTGEDVYRGADSYAGEIGHMNVRPDGPDCLCGSNGCFERMCCGLWMERDYGRTAKEMLADPEFVRKYVVDLARGLKAALMLLNPAAIVIGGGISKAGDALFVPLRAELNRQMTAWSKARRNVVPAALGDDSVLWGALELARRMEGITT